MSNPNQGTIAITGASGFIGSHLAARWRAGGGSVRAVSLRSEPREDAFENCIAVVHLAGEPIAQRWTASVKKRIVESRVEGTRSVVAALAGLKQRPSVLVSASAVGYYGSRGDEELTEDSPPSQDFLGRVATAWESEARRAETLGIRVVCPRFGMVLGAGGGALERLLVPFKLGVGGRIGSGRQWISWIHIDDLIGLILFAICNSSIAGPVNAVAPVPVRNSEFTQELAHAVHRPAIVPVPGFALKVLFGEMSEVILGGQKVLPAEAEQAGFKFHYPELRGALEAIVQA